MGVVGCFVRFYVKNRPVQVLMVAHDRVVALDFRSECRHGTKGKLKDFLCTVLPTARVIKTNKQKPTTVGPREQLQRTIKVLNLR